MQGQKIHPPYLDCGEPKRLLIGGEWVKSVSGETFETLNPATGQIIATVARGNAADIDLAVCPPSAPMAQI